MANHNFSEMTREELEQEAQALLQEARSSARSIHNLGLKLQEEKKKTDATPDVFWANNGWQYYRRRS